MWTIGVLKESNANDYNTE